MTGYSSCYEGPASFNEVETQVQGESEGGGEG
jgi:hypothetical protein